MKTALRPLAVFILLCSFSGMALRAQQSRISGRIDTSQTVVLRGHIRPEVRAEFDQGAVEPSFPLPAITLHLKASPAQQSSLQQLLAVQQDAASPSYHRWLTPEEYADRFGASQSDIQKISAWLQSQGFTVQNVARSRMWLTFSGTAQNVRTAFHTEIHRYQIGGVTHYANASEPLIPAALLASMVTGLRGLNDFRMRPRLVKGRPELNTPDGNHSIAPDDFATIYNVAPLYQAGVDGTGQKMVVVGQTAINLSDITRFRNQFNLPTINLQQVLVPGQTNPGISNTDLAEADLDLEWAGAVARNATIFFVYSGDVFSSLTYAVDQNLAPVVSMSYGQCEASDLVDLPTTQSLAQQANSQGMTWLAAAGDSGAADCEDVGAAVAQNGLTVDSPGSTPEVTSMGGSEFLDTGGGYWSSSNTANGASALSYIPEQAWNDTLLDGSLASGGGGASLYFALPAWQTEPGVPSGSFRNVPDLSVNASADHDGYYVYTGGSPSNFGGTSIGAPTMGGIVTLLNQYLVSNKIQSQPGVGNINPTLYRLAANKSGIFHDITQGNNIVPCAPSTPNCSGGSFGYNAGPNYDQATGLGSPDAYNLVHQWSNQAPVNSAVVPSIDQNPVFQSASPTNGNKWAFTLTLTEEAGIATALTSFTINGKAYEVVATFGTAAIPALGSVSSKNLGLATLTVPTNVIFDFTGMDTSGRQWSQQLSIPFQGVQAPLAVGGVSNAASGVQSYAPGMLISVYGTAMGDFAQSAAAIPLPQYLAGFEASVDGNPAPIYYVSPGQVNIQIPYETQPGQSMLTVGNPYANVNFNIRITDSAPGIFMSNGFVSAPFSSAARGQTTTLFITGEGQVQPGLPDGTTPSANTPLTRLPKPVLPYSVTVGGQPVTKIPFIGIPSGLVGVTQINFQVPSTTPLGEQPVVVTVGGVASPPANLNVTQ